ncbi:hypothetical protein Tco_0805944, partial [Tanacetum coccineum]
AGPHRCSTAKNAGTVLRKATIKAFRACYKGYTAKMRKGLPHILGGLLQMLHDVMKAATSLLAVRGLPHRLQAIAKAATSLTGCYKGCILLQQSLLAHAEAAINVVGCCEGYNRACWLLRRLLYRLPANVKAATKPYGLCGG